MQGHRITTHSLLRIGLSLIVIALGGGAGGCRSMMYRQTGVVVGGFAIDHMLPSLMKSGDINAACNSGQALGPFITSFEEVGATADRATLVSLLSAGMCAEDQAREAELRALRGLVRNEPATVKDARTIEKNARKLAAERFWGAYKRAQKSFSLVEGGPCPKLDRPQDALTLMLGLCAGVLATLHDKAADNTVGVPASLPLTAAHFTQCLDNTQFWGVPQALRASVQASLPQPGDAPDPWAELAAATEMGEQHRIRLANAFAILVHAAAGHEKQVRADIKQAAHSFNTCPGDGAWRLLDAYAARMITHESDKLWTAATGHRTPFAALGTFWNDAAVASPPGDDLLQGLGEGE
jgi:hypothetical protein